MPIHSKLKSNLILIPKFILYHSIIDLNWFLWNSKWDILCKTISGLIVCPSPVTTMPHRCLKWHTEPSSIIPIRWVRLIPTYVAIFFCHTLRRYPSKHLSNCTFMKHFPPCPWGNFRYIFLPNRWTILWMIFDSRVVITWIFYIFS